MTAENTVSHLKYSFCLLLDSATRDGLTIRSPLPTPLFQREIFLASVCVYEKQHTDQATSQGNTVFQQRLGSHFRAKQICYLEKNTATCNLGNLILRENGLQFRVHSFQTVVSGPRTSFT